MTPNKEDYLKCIYELSIQKQKVNNKRMAQVMGVSAPAVTEMFKKLVNSQLVEKTSEYGFQLTLDGLRVVSNLIRKHRLIEVFLLNHLNYDRTQIHKEAEVLEHAVSDYFVDQLDAFLQYPTHCPHGSVIPKKDEVIAEKTLPLNLAVENSEYTLSRFYGDERLFAYMNDLQLNIGDTIRVLSVNVFAQTVVIESNYREITISLAIASTVLVEPKQL